jgi:catechol-2,3-dioxygenase
MRTGMGLHPLGRVSRSGGAGRSVLEIVPCGDWRQVQSNQPKYQARAKVFTTGLSELVLIVKDVTVAAQFYRDVVGLIPETEANDAWAWFWAGEPGHAQRVALHRGPLLFEEHSPLPEGERWGHVHFAFNVARDRLSAAVEQVKAHEVAVYGPTHFDWMRATSYYFYDLDGNLLEFWSSE